jgi:hypothetical protein
MAIFVVDSNFFIQAHRFTYPLDVAMGFWDKIKKMANAGTLISIDGSTGNLVKSLQLA